MVNFLNGALLFIPFSDKDNEYRNALQIFMSMSLILPLPENSKKKYRNWIFETIGEISKMKT